MTSQASIGLPPSTKSSAVTVVPSDTGVAISHLEFGAGGVRRTEKSMGVVWLGSMIEPPAETEKVASTVVLLRLVY